MREMQMNMKNIYRQVAKKHGVSIAEVKREMQAAIDAAYANPSESDATKAQQNRIPRIGVTPTVEEFLRYALEQLQK